MKIFKKIIYIIPLVGMIFASCLDVEKKEFEHLGGLNTIDNQESEQYYADLRAWKATAENYGRPVSFGWFSNWSPEGAIRKGYLASLPDSIDMISMWSAPFELNEAKIADKNIYQQKKGGKIFVCYILHNIGTGITPKSVSEEVQAENPEASSDDLTKLIKKATEEYWGFTSGVKGSEDHIASIQRYSKALVDTIVIMGYDGLDIDWEPNGGGDGDGSLKGAGGKYLHYLVEEVGKYFGPKATERPDGKYYYFLIDGEIWNANKESAPYFDYFITQAYGDSWLDYRVSTLRNWCGEYYEYQKHIFTENFESYWNSGGVLLKQAAYNHANGPKGGVGAFRLDNDYDNTPDYKYTRQAIQENQRAYQEYMDLQSNNNTEEQ
ncbi:glycoside hydrolase family 18 [Bacteroides reticulotermitis]|nr:glycoside hydrolase family 18 [Bacteroides reticulotermitis]